VLRSVAKATGVGAEYSLESEINWSSRREPVFALRLAPDFIMAG